MKRKVTINLFGLVFYGVMITLLLTGRVSSWVALLIILSGFEVNITFEV